LNFQFKGFWPQVTPIPTDLPDDSQVGICCTNQHAAGRFIPRVVELILKDENLDYLFVYCKIIFERKDFGNTIFLKVSVV